MNERLKFSWGHIIAFVALIIVSYISFMGFTYLTNGNFMTALIGMAVTDLVYILFFIGAQQMKASGVKMKRKIMFERFFIFGSPIIFILGMISMSHFWTVRSHNDEIVKTFTGSINNSKQLFADYDGYAQQRIETYERNLNHIIANKGTDPAMFKKAGFEEGRAGIQKENMILTLKLQLLSQNYDTLKNEAIKWIDNASQGASTWNVFLLGNTREIKDALNDWENQLKSFSAKEMTNEALCGEVVHFESNGAKNAIEGIEGLTASYTKQGIPTISAIIYGVIIYLMLIFPYLIQERHTKNVYRLIGTENSRKRGKGKAKKERPVDEETDFEEETDDNYEQGSNHKVNNDLNLEEDNDFPTF